MDPRITPNYQANPYGSTGTPGFMSYDPFPYQDAEFEQKNFLLKEEEYNRYIAVLNEKYRELEIRYSELLEVHGKTEADKENSKRTLNGDIRGLLVAVTEREKRVKEVEVDNKTLLIEIDRLTTILRTQEREVLRLRMDNEDLKVKIAANENYTSIDVGELSRIIDDQKDEISDLRRKLNLSLEGKRKLETEVEALKFSMENMRSKYENELRDKEIRVSQAIREVDNRVESRTKELTHQLDAYYKMEQDNIVLDRKNKELINEITLHINAQKLLKQELEYKDREMESSQRELAIYKATRPGNVPVASAEPKVYQHLVTMCDKRFEREKRGLYFAVWRLLYLYKNEAKFRNFDAQTIQGLDQKTMEKVRFDFDDHGDISVATSLAEGVLKVLKYIREKLSILVFELFLRSASQAEKKKHLNLKELDDGQWRSLTIMLDTYNIIRKLLKIFHPKFMKIKKPQGTGLLEQKLNLSLAKASLKGQNRNEVNRWIENSLVYILHKKRNDPDRNKDFMFLFRMLAIKYRIQSPMAGKQLEIENDLLIYMDHKILASLQKLLRTHDKDRENIFLSGEPQFDPLRETI